jgi:hypothetical protein
LRAIWADKDLPASSPPSYRKQEKYTRNWNRIKRIIVPIGYSNGRGRPVMSPTCPRAGQRKPHPCKDRKGGPPADILHAIHRQGAPFWSGSSRTLKTLLQKGRPFIMCESTRDNCASVVSYSDHTCNLKCSGIMRACNRSLPHSRLPLQTIRHECRGSLCRLTMRGIRGACSSDHQRSRSACSGS